MDAGNTSWIRNMGLRIIRPVLESKWVTQFARRYPHAFKFILARFTLENFLGLPLTLLVAALYLNLILLFDFTDDVVNSGEFVAVDTFIAKLLFTHRIEAIARFFYVVTRICSVGVVAVAGSVLLVYMLIKKQLGTALALIVSIAGSGLTIYLSKRIFELNRPHEFAYYIENSFSFPSGHTTIAVAFYGLLFYLLMRRLRTPKARGVVLLLGILFTGLIGVSRLYLCVHYLSDVIAGYLIGALWMLLSISIFEWMLFRKKINIR